MAEKDGDLMQDKIATYQEQFKDALKNDINTSLALTCLYDVIKDEQLNNNTKIYLIESFDKVLGLNLTTTLEVKEEKIDLDLQNYIEEKITERNQAKKDKNFALADQIRNELLQKGIVLKDTREGTLYTIGG